MGTSLNARQLGAKIDKLASELRDSRGALNKTGMAGKRIFESAAAQSGALGAQLAGKRKTIGVRYDIGRNGQLVITYTGPAHLLNNPTRPHRIEPRRPRGSRRRRGASALTIGGNVRAWANHPGTAGKGFFKRAQATSAATLPEVFARAQITEPMRRIF